MHVNYLQCNHYFYYYYLFDHKKEYNEYKILYRVKEQDKTVARRHVSPHMPFPEIK